MPPREPSIHVTVNCLKQELSKVLTKYNISKQHIELLVADVAIACKQYSLTHRSISISNDKLLRASKKITSSQISNANLMAELLLLCRQKARHVGILRILPGSSGWAEIKDLTHLADQFIQEFNLEVRNGYLTYLKVGMSKMQKFSMGKLKSLHPAICQEYEAIEKINQDKTPSETQRAYELYRDIVSSKTGIPNIGYDKMPEKYCVFIEVKEEAKRMGISLERYVQAQFDGLSFRDQIPDPLQLIGDKAHIRVQRYCYENNINLKKKKVIDYKKIKEQ